MSGDDTQIDKEDTHHAPFLSEAGSELLDCSLETAVQVSTAQEEMDVVIGQELDRMQAKRLH